MRKISNRYIFSDYVPFFYLWHKATLWLALKENFTHLPWKHVVCKDITSWKCNK